MQAAYEITKDRRLAKYKHVVSPKYLILSFNLSWTNFLMRALATFSPLHKRVPMSNQAITDDTRVD